MSVAPRSEVNSERGALAETVAVTQDCAAWAKVSSFFLNLGKGFFDCATLAKVTVTKTTSVPGILFAVGTTALGRVLTGQMIAALSLLRQQQQQRQRRQQ